MGGRAGHPPARKQGSISTAAGQPAAPGGTSAFDPTCPIPWAISTYRQVQFEGIQAILIKVDELTLADPAIDVANFAVHLRLLAMQNLPDPYALDAIADRFVQEYLLYRPSPGFMQRLAFYEIAMVFRLMNAVLKQQQLAQYFEALA